MRRFTPLIVAAVGVVVLVLGLTQIFPPGTVAGIMLLIFGIVWFGLSFIPQPEAVSDERPMPLYESLTKIFYAPAEVFRNLRRHPQWIVPLLIMTVVANAYLFAFYERLTPKKIVDFMVEKNEQVAAQMGAQIPPEQSAQMRQQQTEQISTPGARLSGAVSGFTGWFLGYAFLAAIFLVIVLAMGGSINYWQALAATVFSIFPVYIIRYLLNFVILFIKDPSEIHPIIGQQTLVTDNLGLLVNPADSAILWAILTPIGILSFYWLWLTATGLKHTGERVSGTAAWTGAITVWVLYVAFGIVMAALFPGFFS